MKIISIFKNNLIFLKRVFYFFCFFFFFENPVFMVKAFPVELNKKDSWEGFYFGANAGFHYAQDQLIPKDSLLSTNFENNSSKAENFHSLKDFIGEVFLGFNYSIYPQIILSIEGFVTIGGPVLKKEIDLSSKDMPSNGSPDYELYLNRFSPSFSASTISGRIRIGYELNKFLIFLGGGLDQRPIHVDLTYDAEKLGKAISFTRGIFLNLGFDYKISSNVFTRLEYRSGFYGQEHYKMGDQGFNYQPQELRLGLGYRF